VEDIKLFLNDLFGDNEDKYIVIWTLPDKRSKFFQEVEKAAHYANEMKKTKQVYVGVGLSDKDFSAIPNGEYNRAKTKDIEAIGGLWLDIDIKSDHHKKQNLPETIEEAVELSKIIEELPPSSIIHSGNGIQCWWHFKELWEFDSAEEKQEAEELVKRFIYTFKEHARAKNWDVDSVIDLARVLRIPGTFNRKSDPPKPVKYIERNEENAYDQSEIEPFLIALDNIPTYVSLEDANYNFVLHPDASPPFEKFEALKEIEPKFSMSWERKRKDMQDNSGSSYDLSLGTFAVMAGWTDQETVNLLIASRRKHRDDLKLRPDYYARTLSRCKTVLDKQNAEREIEEFESIGEMETVATSSEIENKRQSYLDTLSKLLGFQIVRIIKYVSDPSTYHLETPERVHDLGEVQNLIEQKNFRKKVADATGKYIPRFKADRWDGIAQALLDVCEEKEIGEDSTTEGQMIHWITMYLAEKMPYSEEDVDDLDEIIRQGLPFKKKGKTFIIGPDLRQWIRINQMEKVSMKEMGTMLRSVQAEPDKVSISTNEGVRSTRSVWYIPNTII
jgi:hypothetical protein